MALAAGLRVFILTLKTWFFGPGQMKLAAP